MAAPKTGAKPGFIKRKEIPERDWMTKEGAEVLAQNIRFYWAMTGLKVRTTVEQVGESFCVRSDMRNGKPIGKRMTWGNGWS